MTDEYMCKILTDRKIDRYAHTKRERREVGRKTEIWMHTYIEAYIETDR